MILRRNNFGLNGLSLIRLKSDNSFDEFLGIGKEARARRQEKREDRRQKKDDAQQRRTDRREERQEKREQANEKRRLKNEMRQAKIEEKKAATTAMTNQVNQLPPVTPVAANDNSATAVALVGGVLVLCVIGFVMMKKKAPEPVQQNILQAA